MKSSRLLTGSLLGSVLACAILLPSAIAQTDDQATPENSSASASTVIDVSGAGTNPQQGTIVKGIDAAGDVAGTYIDALGAYHGFVTLENGTTNTIDVTGAGTVSGQGTIVTAIDTTGNIAGFTIGESGGYFVRQGFVRATDGTITTFTGANGSGMDAVFGINSLGSVTGFDGWMDGGNGFIRATDGTYSIFTAPGDGENTTGIAINTAGTVAGRVSDQSTSDLVSQGFVRTASGTTTIFNPPNVATSPTTNIVDNSGTLPTAIDTAGDIAGTYTDTTGARHSFLRTANGTITTFDPSGTDTSPCAASGMGAMLCGSGALGMDDAGDVVGVYFDTNGVANGYLRYGSTGAFTALTLSEAGTSAFQGTAIFAINASGTVAGTYVDSNSVLHGFTYSLPTTTTTTTITPAPTPNPAIYGEPVTLSATVASGNGTPTDGETVSFVDGSTSEGTGSLSGGVASTTTTLLPAGTDSIAANYGGDSTYVASVSAPVSVVVNQASTTTALSSSLNPSGVGESVNLTATVSGEFGGLPTGSVAFSSGSTSLGSVSLAGTNQAVLTTTALPQGTDSITAVYSGDANFTGSTSTALSQVVNAAATPDFTVSLNPASLTVTGGQSGTSTITVTNEGGFNSDVAFVCTGLPAGATCNFTTQTVPTPSGVTYSTMTVNTTTADAALHRNGRPLFPGSVLAVALYCFGFRKRRRLQMLLLVAMSVAGLTLFTGCGGGSGPQPVTSTVTVTATSGALSRTATFSLTVN